MVNFGRWLWAGLGMVVLAVVVVVGVGGAAGVVGDEGVVRAVEPAVTKVKKPKKGPIKIEAVKLDRAVDFNIDILPILKANCLACHHGKEPDADLVLETRKAMLEGGETGPAIVVGDGLKSLLLRVSAKHEKPYMPPRKNKVGAKALTPKELGLIKKWIDEGAKGAEKRVLEAPKFGKPPAVWKSIYAMAMTDDGKYVAAGRAGEIYIYGVGSGVLVDRPSDGGLAKVKSGLAHLDAVQSMAFSHDGAWLATGGYRVIKLWKKGFTGKTFDVRVRKGKVVGMGGNGKWVGVAQGQEVVLVDAGREKVVGKVGGIGGEVRGIAYSPSGKRMAVVGANKAVVIAGSGDGKVERKFEAGVGLTAVAWAGESVLAAAGEDKVIYSWAVGTDGKGELKSGKAMKGTGGKINGLVAVGSDGKRLASVSEDGQMRLWDTAGGKQLKAIGTGGNAVALAVRGDGKRFATAVGTKVKLWDENFKQVAEFGTDGEAKGRHAAIKAKHDFAKGDLGYYKGLIGAKDKAHKAELGSVKKVKSTVTAAEKTVKDKTAAFEKMKVSHAATKKALNDLNAKIVKGEADVKKAVEGLKAATAELSAAATGQKNADAAYNKVKGVQDGLVKEAGAALKKAETGKKPAEIEKARKALEGVKKTAGAEIAKADGVRKAAKDKATAAKMKVDTLKKAEVAAKKLVSDSKRGLGGAKKKLATSQKNFDNANAQKQQAEASVAAAKQRVVRAEASVARAAAAVETAKKAEQAAIGEVAKLAKALEEAAMGMGRAAIGVRSLGFTADGGLLMAGGADGVIYTFSSGSGAAGDVVKGHGAAIVGLRGGGSGVVSLGADGKVRVGSVLPRWVLTKTIKPESKGASSAPIDRVLALEFSPDDRHLVSGGGMPSREGELAIWNVKDGSLVREVKDAHSDTIFDVEYNLDGSRIATASADRFAKVFEAGDGKLVHSFEGHTHHVLSVSWNRTGRTIASGSADNSVKVWDVVQGQRKKTIGGFKKELTGLRYLGYLNRFVVTGVGDVVRQYNEGGGKERDYSGSSSLNYALTVSGNGQYAASGGQDSTVRVWRTSDGKLVGTFGPVGK